MQTLADQRTVLATVLFRFGNFENHAFVISLHIAFLFSPLPFLSMLPSDIKETCNKTDQFCTAQQYVENSASESDRVCDYLTSVRLGSFQRGKGSF